MCKMSYRKATTRVYVAGIVSKQARQATMPTTPRIVEKCVWWMNSPEYGERKLTSDLVSPLIYYPTGLLAASGCSGNNIFLSIVFECTYYLSALQKKRDTYTTPHLYEYLWPRDINDCEAQPYLPYPTLKQVKGWYTWLISYVFPLSR